MDTINNIFGSEFCLQHPNHCTAGATFALYITKQILGEIPNYIAQVADRVFSTKFSTPSEPGKLAGAIAAPASGILHAAAKAPVDALSQFIQNLQNENFIQNLMKPPYDSEVGIVTYTYREHKAAIIAITSCLALSILYNKRNDIKEKLFPSPKETEIKA